MTPNDPRQNDADPAALLAWYVEAGVDIALDETPVDRLVPPPPQLSTEAKPVAVSNAPAPGRSVQSMATIPASNETALAAHEIASAAKTLDELREALVSFDGCNLKLTATQLVFADGNPSARIMFVGEAPGREEDIQGVPFVGRSGRLLDLMLAAIGLDRTSVYIANVVPWRPPGNRTPTPQETATCRPFIDRQIELVAPDFLICLGGAAAKELMATSQGILRLRGQWREFLSGERKIHALATLHPAYLLRQPLQKRLAWRDFLTIKAALEASQQRSTD